jgi:hypothetical protein
VARRRSGRRGGISICSVASLYVHYQNTSSVCTSQGSAVGIAIGYALNDRRVGVRDAVGSRMTASVVWWSDFLAANPEVPGSIPGTTRFFRVAVGLERGPLGPCEDK